MKKFLSNILSHFGGQKEIVLGRSEIEATLPHRGDKLLLNRAVISEQKIVGQFLVTEEVCAGHVIAGVALMRGSDFCDMAAQLIGILVSQHPEINGPFKDGTKTLAALRYDGVSFRAAVHPGEMVYIETNINLEVDERHGFVEITGGRFIVRVGDSPKPRVTISAVTLTPVDTESIKTKTG